MEGLKMTVLSDWLADLELDAFRRSYLGRQPLAKPGSARSVTDLCTWQHLGSLLAAEPAPDVLVVAQGKSLSLPAPRTLAALEALFARGVGIVVRHPERHCALLRDLTRAFSGDLPGEQRVLLFATPGRSNGFGWHYDPEDVFVVQTAGDKEYYFRENTVRPRPVREPQPDFAVYRFETTPMMSCRLLAGDWLYLPRGFWHVAHAHEHSLSLSIGVFPEA
jgi:50S ribosomal protein L16 3-hydroxylase